MRTGQSEAYNFAEIRAYKWIPLDETNSIISADVMPNYTLINSVHLTTLRSTDKNYGGLSTNSLFSTGPAVNCFWKMNIGSI